MGGNYGIRATMNVQWEPRNRDTRSRTVAKCCHQYGVLRLHGRALAAGEDEGKMGGVVGVKKKIRVIGKKDSSRWLLEMWRVN